MIRKIINRSNRGGKNRSVSITQQRIGKYTYLYKSVTLWNEELKRWDCVKSRSIGKIDSLTGKPMYKKEYLEELAAAGKSVARMKVWQPWEKKS